MEGSCACPCQSLHLVRALGFLHYHLSILCHQVDLLQHRLLPTSSRPYRFRIAQVLGLDFCYLSCSDPFPGINSLSVSPLQPGVRPYPCVGGCLAPPCLPLFVLDFLCSHSQHHGSIASPWNSGTRSKPGFRLNSPGPGNTPPCFSYSSV